MHYTVDLAVFSSSHDSKDANQMNQPTISAFLDQDNIISSDSSPVVGEDPLSSDQVTVPEASTSSAPLVREDHDVMDEDIECASSESDQEPEVAGQPPVAVQSSFSDELSTSQVRVLDIGILLKNGQLKSLSRSGKLDLISQTPDPNYSYPTKIYYGKNRRFKPDWVKPYSWVHYSSSEDGVYCKACALFAPTSIGRSWVY